MKETVSKAEAARMLGVSRANINYLIKQNHLQVTNGPKGYQEVLLQSVKGRLNTHGTKNPYFSNEEVTDMFEQYLSENGITIITSTRSVYSGETGPDFHYLLNGKEYFVEIIGSNPSRGTQSNAFRSAFQGAISRISDPESQVPVIVMHTREERGMGQRASSWGKWGWTTCFSFFEFWFIDEKEDEKIKLIKYRALDFTPLV